jgi:DNA polymerase-3 subunit delta
LQKDKKVASRPGFNICLGPDSVLLREHIDALLDAHAPDGGFWEKSVFWGDEPLDDGFWEKLTRQSLFNQFRAVILRQAQSKILEQSGELRKISAALGRGSERIWPFLCFEVPYEKGKIKIPAFVLKLQCVSFAQKQGWYKEIPPLDSRGLQKFVAKEALALGFKLSPEEIESLSSFMPPDAGAIKLALGKVALACPEKRLTREALSMFEPLREMDVFAFLQGLQSGKNPAAVWGKFMQDQISFDDAGLFAFLGALQREARILWQLLSGEPVALPSFLIQNKTSLAKSLGFGKLARIWDFALFADKGVKTGEHSPKQAFELLIAGLFQLFGTAYSNAGRKV